MPTSNLSWIDFGMMVPEQLFLKQNEMTLALDYVKDLTLFKYGVKDNFVLLSQEESEVWWLPECLVWCEAEKSNRSDGTVAVEDIPEELEWEIVEPVFLNLWYHHAAVWEGKAIVVMVDDSHLPDRATTQI